MRTVELMGFDVGTSIPENKLQEAVGYLSTWNVGVYSHVRIIFEADIESLLAFYWVTRPESVLDTHSDHAINAIWLFGGLASLQHFSFSDN